MELKQNTMQDNIYEKISQRYEIVAVDDYEQTPYRVYLASLGCQPDEFTEVIAIDLVVPAVWLPQMLGSYLKFMRPVRKVLPEKDDINFIWRTIFRLPEIQLEELKRMMLEFPEIKDEGYLKFYDLENYIFTTVRERFFKGGSIGAEDFFCIVIWKANRAKSKIAKMLLREFKTLEIATRAISGYLRNENLNDFDRFKFLMERGFALPMLSAILTVLFPERFTIYDYRVCSNPGFEEFQKLSYKMVDIEKYWELYQEYKQAVIRNTPSEMNLRQKDQYLWGKSFMLQLQEDIQRQFKKIDGYE